jgi:GDPmannose 4,6-dehydratase
MKTALITGVNGQDGSYLADFLLSKDYRVIGLQRRTVGSNADKHRNISHIVEHPNFIIESGDVTDSSSLWRAISSHSPREIYNLAAQSHVGESFKSPVSTTEINAIGTLNILEAVRNIDPSIRFYQASTSEMFGDNVVCPQSETTRFSPVSPYGVSKMMAHNMVSVYRKSYQIHANSGILFNHESPRRGENFVTRKITKAAARIKLGLQDKLLLGNLEAQRDWGFAGDYVKAMWMMLQQDNPDDYVIATGTTHSVQDFLEFVFEHAGLDVEVHVGVDPRFYRPCEVPRLWGDPTKAQQNLGWKPDVSFRDLAIMMYESDLQKEMEFTND